MAKKDNKRQIREIDYQGKLAQNHLDNLRTDMVVPQAQQANNNYSMAAAKGFQDYDRLMGGYEDWAKTGGFNKADLGAIRSRALSPMRAVYSNANREVDRARTLQGGYSPGHGVLKARMAREQSSGMSDAATNAEAAIAELVNSGKKFGMQGQSSMFSATPGLASHYGQQQDSTMNRWLGTEEMQQRLGLGKANAYTGSRGEGFDYSWIPKPGFSAGPLFAS